MDPGIDPDGKLAFERILRWIPMENQLWDGNLTEKIRVWVDPGMESQCKINFWTNPDGNQWKISSEVAPAKTWKDLPRNGKELPKKEERIARNWKKLLKIGRNC